MKAVILYHPQSDHGTMIETFARDFSRQTGRKIELISLESRDGADMAARHDIVQYPAILAMDNEGKMLRLWQGPVLPLMNEVSYYTQDK